MKQAVSKVTCIFPPKKTKKNSSVDINCLCGFGELTNHLSLLSLAFCVATDNRTVCSELADDCTQYINIIDQYQKIH